jgi:cation diffusion facilitator CzcD-associated flavoprotein CzcO
LISVEALVRTSKIRKAVGTTIPGVGALSPDIDPEVVRAKYLEERDKRRAVPRLSRPMTGSLAHYLTDPYMQATEREPVSDEVDVVIVGAGFGGLLTAATLMNAGVKRVRLIDTAGDVSGTWYWNRYPGAMCDVESYIYLPLLEQTGYMPTQKYAFGHEILDYCRLLAQRFGLYEDALFHTKVESARWAEGQQRWIVETDRGDEIVAQFFIISPGPFIRPKLPDIPGIGSFEGPSFHTSRWDYAVTGGSAEGDTNLSKLGDKVVGIVGTAASAVQSIPALARSSGHLYVFQRTPSTVGIQANTPTDLSWAASLKPGWQNERMQNFQLVVSGLPHDADLVNDYTTWLRKGLLVLPKVAGITPEEARARSARADLEIMEMLRARVDEEVKDPDAAAALKPYYSFNCKRPCFHDEFLAVFNRPNVTLVDTQGRGLDSVYKGGVAAAGKTYDLDMLIFATGFDTSSDFTERIGFDVTGRRGQSLTAKWADGVATLHGSMTSGFPNFFLIPGLYAQTAVVTNWTHLLQEYATHFTRIITRVYSEGAEFFDVTEEAEAKYVQLILEKAPPLEGFLDGCTPGRMNNEGRMDLRPKRNVNFGGNSFDFFNLLAEWRDVQDMAGLEFAS